MHEDCIGSQGPQRSVVFQKKKKKKKKKKLNSYRLLTKLRTTDVAAFVTACYIDYVTSS